MPNIAETARCRWLLPLPVQAGSPKRKHWNLPRGRAPNGTCGALYAAKMMQPDHSEALEDYFRRGAKNCTLCKEIRPNAVIPCNRCVEIAGEALDFLSK